MNKSFFYSILTFSYTKYFVHSYTLDVVFTLSSYIYVYHVILFHWRIVSCHGCRLIGFAVLHSSCPTRCKQHVACCNTLVAKWEISPQWHTCDMSFHTLFIAFVSDYFKHFKNHFVSPARYAVSEHQHQGRLNLKIHKNWYHGSTNVVGRALASF